MIKHAETLEEREEAMRVVLRHIQEKRPFELLDREQQRILKECQDAGYFEGVVLTEMISGRVAAEYRFNPRLTYKGLQFLYPEEPESPSKVEVSLSETERALQSDQKEKDNAENKAERNLDRRYQLIGAILVALFTLFLEHIGEIVSFIAQLLHQ